jgi:FMN phosphatase YigB (HAD superfamily)
VPISLTGNDQVRQHQSVPVLLFDLDDTLVDRQRVFDVWAAQFVSTHGGDDEGRTWLRRLDDEGRTPREAFWGAIRERFELAQSVQELVASWGLELPALYACSLETIDALRGAHAAGWATGIVTNGDSQVQERKIRAAGIEGLVDVVCISGREGMEKPDPRLFRLAAQRTGHTCADGWMVGDNAVLDIAGGAAAGLQTAWLSRGRGWSRTDGAPTITVKSVQEAVSRIVGHTG